MDNNFIPAGFAANLKYYRKLRGLTTEKLAEQIGLNHSTITRYELKLREPSTSILLQISNALDISADDLIADKTFFNNKGDWYKWNQ